MQIQKLHYTKLNQPQKLQNNNKQNSKTKNNISSDMTFTGFVTPKKVLKVTAWAAILAATFGLGRLVSKMTKDKDKIKPQIENIQQIQEDAKKEFVESNLNIDKKNLAIQLERDNKGINNAFKAMNQKTELLEGEGVYECFMSNEIKEPYNTSDEVIKFKITNDINTVKENCKNSDASDLLSKDNFKMIPFDEVEGKRWAKLPKIIASVSDNTGDSILNVLGEKYKAIADKALKQARNNPFMVRVQIRKMKKPNQIYQPKTFAIPKKIYKIKYYVKNI